VFRNSKRIKGAIYTYLKSNSTEPLVREDLKYSYINYSINSPIFH